VRQLTYCEAINEALIQEMERDPTVFVYGIGVPDHKRVFGATNDLVEQFGADRCYDTPLSEDAMTGFGIGAAINGLRPVHVHIRVDFALLAMNQIVNMAASHRYITGQSVPLVIRMIVGRGWGQGCHHSKSLHSFFAHVPGLKVVLPSRPYDAKGLLIAAIRDKDPVIVIEHRWLYWATGNVPEAPYIVPLGTANVIRTGKDLTIVATSWMCAEALHAADILERHHGMSVEVVDVRSLSPLDMETIRRSVEKTGLCVVADNDWLPYGAGAEVSARINEVCFSLLRRPVGRVGFAWSPCPTARHLENAFYPSAKTIVRCAEQTCIVETPADLSGVEFYAHERRFKGPF
jgi:pyruvate dehydrogenase E1 component beta subunit